jgi:hypothetical protein
VLTVSEVLAAARAAGGSKARIGNRSRQVERDAELAVSVALTDADRRGGPVRVRTSVLVDEAQVVVSYGKHSVVFSVDELDPAAARWVAVGPGETRAVVHGAGDVERAVSAARMAAGIPDHRSRVRSQLSFGGRRPMDTTGALR